MYRKAVTDMKSVGVYLHHVEIVFKEPDRDQRGRFVFRFPRYERRDEDAERLGESFVYSMEFLWGPIASWEDLPCCVFRIPAEMIRESSYISLKMLGELDAKRQIEERTISFSYSELGAVYVGEETVEAAWRMTPVVYQNEALLRALTFLGQSYHHFYVCPGDFNDVLDEPDMKASTGRIQSEWENALQNAFKAIEAVIGDPPKDDRKFFHSLSSIGIDPADMVGYGEKTSIANAIRVMNAARDKKAAHGSLASRELTIGEVLNHQACAKYVVRAAVEYKLGEPIY